MPFLSKCLIPLHLFTYRLGIYNDSKAALTSARETWSFEFETLGVRTVNLITLDVKTTSIPKGKGVEISETSHYFKIREFIYDLNVIAGFNSHASFYRGPFTTNLDYRNKVLFCDIYTL
jgi:hypothetical protein